MLNKVWVRRMILMAMDVAFVIFALFFGIVLRYSLEGGVPDAMWAQTWRVAPLIALVFVVVYAIGGVYGILWRLADAEEMLRLLIMGAVSFVAVAILNTIFHWGVPISVQALTAALSAIASTVARLIWRVVRGGRLKWRQERSVNGAVMVIGAGEAGAYVINRYLTGTNGNGANIILVDDDPLKQGRKLHGVLVRGTSGDIEKLARDFDVKEIVVAIPSLAGDAYTELITRCNATKSHIRILTDPHRVGEEGSPADKRMLPLRELNISDFLSREPVVLDTDSISGYIKDKVVLVSGGGGSIGSEICRQVMRFGPKKLVILDFYENGAYELLTELKQKYGQDCCAMIAIGSIREKDRLAEVFDAHRPQVVFHAAAHKHVSLMEAYPAEAVKNNVFGTMHLLDIASSYGVERFVQLSTDKAVNPSCIMGATKRVAEMLNQLYAGQTPMKCMVVRFGNVLGSHGSVIPLFEAQIKAGGPVTVTDPAVTRYFMTIAEAAQLVLQAGSLAQSGATYVLEMGRPVRIQDMAEKLIRFYGYEPGVDMQIVHTGLREGEKLHEELMTQDERSRLTHTAHKKIMISPRIDIDEAVFFGQIDRLREAARYNTARVGELLAEILDPQSIQEEEISQAASGSV